MNRITASKLFLPVLVLMIAIAVAVMLILVKPEVEEKDSEFPPLSVDVASAIADQHVWTANFQGVVRAKTDIELVTQVTGKVVEVSDQFIEGGRFELGEMLIKIDDADYKVALKSAEAAVASASVDYDMELASAATSAKEWQDLQGRPISEANPLRLNKPQTQRAKAQLDAAQAQLDAANLNLSRTIISAPFAGRIKTKSAELGQFLARGSSIGEVFSVDAMEIRIPMTDIQLGELGLSPGYQSNPESLLLAKVSTEFGIKTQQWQGYLKSVDASIDSDTRLLYSTIVVEQPFANTAEHSSPLVPGLFVDVQLNAAEPLKGLIIPRSALRNGTQVYSVDEGKLRIKSVRVILTSPEFAVLSDESLSLVAGEQVIVSSVPGAFDGMSIKVNNVENASTINAATSNDPQITEANEQSDAI